MHVIIFSTGGYRSCSGISEVPNLRHLIYGTIKTPSKPFTIRSLPNLVRLDLYQTKTTHGTLLLDGFTNLRILTLTRCRFKDIKFPPKGKLMYIQAVQCRLTNPYIFQSVLPELRSVYFQSSVGFQKFLSVESLLYVNLICVKVSLLFIESTQL